MTEYLTMYLYYVDTYINSNITKMLMTFKGSA